MLFNKLFSHTEEPENVRTAAEPEKTEALITEADAATANTAENAVESAAENAAEKAAGETAEDRPEGGLLSEDARKKTKKAAAGAAAGLAAVSLLLGSVFTKPAEFLQDTKPDDGKPTVVVEYNAPVDEDVEAEEEDGDEKKKTLKDMIRAFVQNLPVWARLLFVLPLWILGYALIALLTALFEPVIAPVLAAVLKWLLFAGLLALGLFFVKKAIAPDTPLREIFSKRNLLLVAAAAAVLGTGDYFAKEYVEHYEAWRNWICCAAGAVILTVFALRTRKRTKTAPAE